MYDVCLMILVPDRSYQFEYISDFKGPENIFQEKLSTTIDNIAYCVWWIVEKSKITEAKRHLKLIIVTWNIL